MTFHCRFEIYWLEQDLKNVKCLDSALDSSQVFWETDSVFQEYAVILLEINFSFLGCARTFVKIGLASQWFSVTFIHAYLVSLSHFVTIMEIALALLDCVVKFVEICSALTECLVILMEIFLVSQNCFITTLEAELGFQ